MSAKRACLHFADRPFSHVVPHWGSGWLTAWRFQPCPSSSRHVPPPPRSKNGSNVCGAGKLKASYSQSKTPVPNLCDGNTDTAWGDWQSKGSVKPEPWASWTFDEAKTLDYDLSGSLNIETQAYPRRSRSRSRRMVTSSRPRRASPGDGDACKRLPAANRRSRRVRHSPRCAVMCNVIRSRQRGRITLHAVSRQAGAARWTDYVCVL